MGKHGHKQDNVGTMINGKNSVKKNVCHQINILVLTKLLELVNARLKILIKYVTWNVEHNRKDQSHLYVQIHLSVIPVI